VFNLTESEKQNRVVDLIDVVKDQVRQTDGCDNLSGRPDAFMNKSPKM
jgi:hypothetical protein